MMATLGALLDMADGLYREDESGATYTRQDLMQAASAGEMAASIKIERLETGVYRIHARHRRFLLLSRRRRRRVTAE